jgi:hypothetical protein
MWVEIGNQDLRINSPALYLALGLPAMAALRLPSGAPESSRRGAALVVVGFLGAFGSGMVWWGGTIMAVALTAFSRVLYRAIRR